MSVTIGRNTNILKEMLRIPSTPPKTVNRLILAPNTVNRLILASKTVKAIGGVSMYTEVKLEVKLTFFRRKCHYTQNSARALENLYKEPGNFFKKAHFFRNDTWVCLDFKSKSPPESPRGIFFKSRLNLAAILDLWKFRIFDLSTQSVM